jgi:sigma-E factor negative regulatory protein RseC
MIEERALVVSLMDDAIWVETQRRSACGQCAVSKSCGTATLGKVLGTRRSRVRALNPEGTSVRVGDEVVIGIAERALVRGSLAIYIVPLLSLFLFGMLGQALAQQMAMSSPDLFAVGFGLLGLVLGFGWVRWFSCFIRDNPLYQPVLLRRILSVVSV